MIATFEKQAAATYHVAGATIELATGERYAGLMLGQGEPAYHLILLPGENESVNWSGAREWAKEQGGSLPTRREQSLLFANLKSESENAYYWSGEEHESNAGWAWCQNFTSGYEGSNIIEGELRARAVRRFIPE